MPNTPTTREEKFAYCYALGYGATDAARLAGYAEATLRAGAYRLVQKPAIRHAISQYRESLGFIDSHLLAFCLDQYKRIASDEKAASHVRLSAIQKLVELRSQVALQAQGIDPKRHGSEKPIAAGEPFPHKSPVKTSRKIR